MVWKIFLVMSKKQPPISKLCIESITFTITSNLTLDLVGILDSLEKVWHFPPIGGVICPPSGVKCPTYYEKSKIPTKMYPILKPTIFSVSFYNRLEIPLSLWRLSWANSHFWALAAGASIVCIALLRFWVAKKFEIRVRFLIMKRQIIHTSAMDFCVLDFNTIAEYLFKVLCCLLHITIQNVFRAQ